MKRLGVILLVLICAVSVGSAAPEGQKYTCPMHPHYISDKQGACPICGMDLVPVETGPDGAAPKQASASAQDERLGVTIAPEIIQNMGVRIAPAETVVLGRTVRAFGTVADNARLQTVVAGRVEGWVEELAVTAVGDEVKKGDLLFRLYSPDLVAAQQDYLAALASGSGGRTQSASRRLAALGVQERALEELRKGRAALTALPFYAVHDGTVSALEVREGAFVKPGAKILVIQDYSSVWVMASVAEQDLPLVTAGLPARLEFSARTGEARTGVVDYVYPTVDSESRTGKVRLVLENPESTLRPGAYADVVFDVARRERLAVPSEAVLRDSRGEYVVLGQGNGRFQPRRIRAGVVSGGSTEVLSGLEAGDSVVVSGQFLIDSESALRESFRKLTAIATPLALIEISPADLSMVDHFVDAALYLHELLIKGRDVTPSYFDAALRAGERLKPRFGNTALGPVLAAAAAAVREAQKARTEDEIRSALAALVSALKPWLTEGRPAHYREKKLRLAADHETGRLWLQVGGELANPYGAGMAHETPLPEQAPAAAANRETADRPRTTGTGHDHR